MYWPAVAGQPAVYRQLGRELCEFHYDDHAQRGGGEEDESPEREPTKTWQDAIREKSLISVHDFCRTPETQPFDPVSCRIHPKEADTHSGVKRRAEETDYYNNREQKTEYCKLVHCRVL
jgi:hypothetical protein